MQYLLLLYTEEAGWFSLTPAQQEEAVAAYGAFIEALQRADVLRGMNRLQPSSTATTVRAPNGKAQVLDGPYAESKEQLGGYFLIDVADLDAALAWAGRCPAAAYGAVEVRPIWSMPGR